MDELVVIGKTVTTFGIKGELKVISDFEYIEKAFKVGNHVLINNIEHVITNVRYHKNNILLTIDDLDNINKVLEYVGFNIYIKRLDLNLKEGEYLLKDLINVKIIDDKKDDLGVITEVLMGSPNNFVRVNDSFLVPLIDHYIESFDKNNNILYTKNVKDLR